MSAPPGEVPPVERDSAPPPMHYNTRINLAPKYVAKL